MANSREPGPLKCRRILVRNLMSRSGCESLRVVSKDSFGNLSVEPFERETSSTLFIDSTVAMLAPDRTDELLIDILNSIATFDELLSFIHDSDILVEKGSRAVLAAIDKHKCRLIDLE